MQQDQIDDQLSIKEFVNPFTDGKELRDKKRSLEGLPQERNAVGRPIRGPLKELCSSIIALLRLLQTIELSRWFLTILSLSG